MSYVPSQCRCVPWTTLMWHRNGELEGLICIYVDDFLWAGTDLFYEGVVKVLRTKFLIGSSASASFTYVGLCIKSYTDGITVDQSRYISSLIPIPICKARSTQKNSLLSASEKTDYRALVGQLHWVATHTRPDIAFDTCDLSISYHKATVADLLRLNKLVGRVQREHLNIFFPRLQSLSDCSLECYTDAAFANLPNGGSQGAFIIFLKDSIGRDANPSARLGGLSIQKRGFLKKKDCFLPKKEDFSQIV